MAIDISREAKQRMVESFQRYFAENMEEEIGQLKASLLLEFCLKEIGPTIYNRAIYDAQAYMQDRVGDIEGACHEREFSYWRE